MPTIGLDQNGRRIVVIVGKNFPASEIDHAKLICYMISTLDSIVERVCVIVVRMHAVLMMIIGILHCVSAYKHDK